MNEIYNNNKTNMNKNEQSKQTKHEYMLKQT